MTTTPLLPTDTTYLDKMDPTKNCPGFKLWEVKVWENETTYLMAGDEAGGVKTRLFFKTEGALNVKSIELLGPNPAVAEWDRIRSAR